MGRPMSMTLLADTLGVKQLMVYKMDSTEPPAARRDTRNTLRKPAHILRNLATTPAQ